MPQRELFSVYVKLVLPFFNCLVSLSFSFPAVAGSSGYVSITLGGSLGKHMTQSLAIESGFALCWSREFELKLDLEAVYAVAPSLWSVRPALPGLLVDC